MPDEGEVVVEDGNVTICGPTAGSGAEAPDQED
jgi:hypothetical protein